MANKPATQVSCGNVVASIWENEKRNGEGTYQSVTFQRIYRDGDGNWQYADSFFPADLLTLSHTAARAFDASERLRREAAEKSATDAAQNTADAPY